MPVAGGGAGGAGTELFPTGKKEYFTISRSRRGRISTSLGNALMLVLEDGGVIVHIETHHSLCAIF